MSNPEMEKPTEQQQQSLSKMLADLHQTVMSIEKISDTMGDLRRELNDTLSLLARLREVIGPEARCYGYSTQSVRWHDIIDERKKKAKEFLK